jgi:hypothetical protein
VSVLSTRPRINQEMLDRIEIGMTRTEVAAILGAPPGDYRTGPTILLLDGPSLLPPCQEHTSWWGDDMIIEVGWCGGRVCWREESPFLVARVKQSLPDRLLWHYRNGWRMLTGS